MDSTSALPAAVRLAWWGTAWLRGHVVADHLIDAVVDQDATHLVAFPDSAPEPLITGLGRLRAAGADALGAALPAEGDPVGLGGPAAFNAAAFESGEAVVALDAAGFGLHGLVPVRVGAARHLVGHGRRTPPAARRGRGGPGPALGAAGGGGRARLARRGQLAS